ncbi:MAG: manganese efflux pump MntP family protein [Desulfovibrionaceae bacterium]
MSTVQLLLLAVALAMDAFAVALAAGATLPCVTARRTFRLAWHFGLFQAVMPVLGWALGLGLRRWIESFDHWLAFALLAFVGGRMIWEAFDHAEDQPRRDPTRGATLVLLSVATSIDALAVGLSLALLGAPILVPVLVIGLVAFAFTAAGMHLGRGFRQLAGLGRTAEVLGGLVLLAIGVHILHEHGALNFF